MFSNKNEPTLPDLSTDLSDEDDWKVGTLRKFDFPSNVTTLAVEPIAGLLAAGTNNGVVYIFGGPSVESQITLPEAIGLRLLQFSISTYFLLCLDDNSQLHIYNLLEYGKPRMVTSVRFDPVNSITLSPSHTHVLLALQNGEVRTYDLTCLRKSPYTMPNMWKSYEESQAASGIPSLISQPTPKNAVETVIHPRNLNLVFVAYAGGVVLTDLTERTTLRAYELILPPGAPGGSGYGADDILSHRQIAVTCLAVHPSGHILAIGYTDGSISFWAVEDDTKPLTVKTLDSENVHVVNSALLEASLEKRGPSGPQSLREPIFKLSWSGFQNSSDPRGGDTVLTILGGFDSSHLPGVTLHALPAFNPLEPPADPSIPQGQIHPAFRRAMLDSITPRKEFFYETRGVVQDYLLIPRASPHFGAAFEPYAICFIIDAERSRFVEAYQFPPPGFISLVVIEAPVQPPEAVVDEEEDEEAWAAGLVKSPRTAYPHNVKINSAPASSLLKSPRLVNKSPLPLRTPFTLVNSSSGILGGSIFKLDNDTYEDFIDNKDAPDLCLDLKGGRAFVDSAELNELKLSKYQPRRILVTFNRDLSIRFFDLSTPLLIPPSGQPLQNDWPKAIAGLTIHLVELTDDTIFSDALFTPVSQISIRSVHVAPEALECAIVLVTGEVVVYHEAASNPPRSGMPNKPAFKELKSLEHIPARTGSRLKPHFVVAAGRGPVEACALSDIGFLAISYVDGSLIIVDMRGPSILLSQVASKRHRHSIVPTSPVSAGPDLVKSLKWTVCSLEKEVQLKVRLVAVSQSGHGEVYTLANKGSASAWTLAGEPTPVRCISDVLPEGVFILDSRTGAQWEANRARLSASLKKEIPLPPTVGATGLAAAPCVLLTVGAKGARVSASVNGEKVAKVEWGSKAGHVQAAQVVSHNGSHALIMQTNKQTGLAYTLPHLEPIATVQLPALPPMPLSIEESGDFVAWVSANRVPGDEKIQQLLYGTFFDFRRAYTRPDIEYGSTRGTIPSQPQPVSLGPASLLQLGSWFSAFSGTKTGDQIDELLGGPDRPIPERIVAEKARSAAEDAGATPAGGVAAGLAASATAMQENLYNRLTGAMNERGQLLNDLEERFNSLEEGSRNMVAQAKRLAAQQTAKGWFGF